MLGKWTADNIVKISTLLLFIALLIGFFCNRSFADAANSNDEFLIKIKLMLSAINSFVPILFTILSGVLVYFFKRLNILEATFSKEIRDATTKLAVACADIASRDNRLNKVERDIDRLEAKMMGN